MSSATPMSAAMWTTRIVRFQSMMASLKVVGFPSLLGGGGAFAFRGSSRKGVGVFPARQSPLFDSLLSAADYCPASDIFTEHGIHRLPLLWGCCLHDSGEVYGGLLHQRNQFLQSPFVPRAEERIEPATGC